MSESSADHEPAERAHNLVAHSRSRLWRRFSSLTSSASPGPESRQFVLRLTLLADARISIQASFPGGSSMTVSRLPTEILDPEPNEQQSTSTGQLDGLSLFRVLFPAPILRHLEEFVARDSTGHAPLVLEIDDEQVWRIPWEQLCVPDERLPLHLPEHFCLVRRAISRHSRVPVSGGAPAPGALKVNLIATTLNNRVVDLAHKIYEHDDVIIGLSTSSGAEDDRADVVIDVRDEYEQQPSSTHAKLHIRVSDQTLSFEQALTCQSVLVVPEGLSDVQLRDLLKVICHSLANGESFSQAIASGRHTIGRSDVESTSQCAIPMFASNADVTQPALIPLADRHQAQGSLSPRTWLPPGRQIMNWLKNVAATSLASLSLLLLGAFLFGVELGGDARFTLGRQLFPDVMLDLSALEERVLQILSAGIALTAIAYSALYVLLLKRGRLELDSGQFSLARTLCFACFNQRIMSIILGAVMVIGGSYAYQQYLWRTLQVPEGVLGFAITKAAAADLLQSELENSLRETSLSRETVIRELPVNFGKNDAGIDVARARALGSRLNVDALIVYSRDEIPGGFEFTASIVFMDPDVGLIIDRNALVASPGATETGDTGSTVLDKNEIETTTLRVDSRETDPRSIRVSIQEIVTVASGIIAYREDQFGDAIAFLEPLAERPSQNQGVINYYLGNAYLLDYRPEHSERAHSRSIAHFERLVTEEAQITRQDRLIHVKTLLELGMLSAANGEWESAIEQYLQANAQYSHLTERGTDDAVLAEVHMTFARIYSLLADAFRYQSVDDGSAHENRRFWYQQAHEELERVLAIREDIGDVSPLHEVDVSRTLYFLGDCYQAIETLEQIVHAHPHQQSLKLDLASLALEMRGYPYAWNLLDQVTDENPENIRALKLKGMLAWSMGINGIPLDPGMIRDVEEELDFRYFDPEYLRRAAEYFEEIRKHSPQDVVAIQSLAYLQTWFAIAELEDFTSLYNGDTLIYVKSVSERQRDPLALERAAEHLDESRENLRLLTELLRPTEPAYQVDLLGVYARRHEVHARALRFLPQGDEPDYSHLLADGESIRELVKSVLEEDSPATRAQQALAWNALLSVVHRELSLYSYHHPSNERTDWLREEFLDLALKAVEFVDEEPPSTPVIAGQYRDLLQFAYQAITEMADEPEQVDAVERRLAEVQEQFDLLMRQQFDHFGTVCEGSAEQSAAIQILNDNPELSREHLERAFEIDPELLAVRYNLGIAYFYLKDHEQAMHYLELETQRNPQLEIAWSNLGNVHIARGDAESRVAAYEQYFQRLALLPPQHRMSLLRVSIRDLHKLLERQPELAGNVAAALPMFADALDDFAHDLEYTEQYANLHAQLGRLAMQAGDAAFARTTLIRSLDLEPTQPMTVAYLALAEHHLGESIVEREQEVSRTIHDPIWFDTLVDGGIGPADLAQSVREELERIAETLPEFALSAVEVQGLIPRAGVTDFSYRSPTLGIELDWESGEFLYSTHSEGNFDLLELTPFEDVLPNASFRFETFVGDNMSLELCIGAMESSLSLFPEVLSFASVSGDHSPLWDNSADAAGTEWQIELRTGSVEVLDVSMAVECRTVVHGKAYVRITRSSRIEDRGVANDMTEQLLASLRIPTFGGD